MSKTNEQSPNFEEQSPKLDIQSLNSTLNAQNLDIQCLKNAPMSKNLDIGIKVKINDSDIVDIVNSSEYPNKLFLSYKRYIKIINYSDIV